MELARHIREVKQFGHGVGQFPDPAMDIKHTFSSAFSLERERRLCRFADMNQANESLRGLKAQRENKDLKAARDLFDNSIMRREYPELDAKHPLDRSYFQSLLLEGAVPEEKSLPDVNRKEIDVIDPLDLLKLPDDQLGAWLIARMPKKMIQAIDPSEDPTRVGQHFKDRVLRSQEDWLHEGKIRDPLVLSVTLEHYRKTREELDGVLREHSIRVPDKKGDVASLGDRNLTRREYLSLLKLLWRDEIKLEEIAIAARVNVESLRTFTGTHADATKRVEEMYTNITYEELGPKETLKGFGIGISPDTRRAYLNLIQGKPADFREALPDARATASIAPTSLMFVPGETAAVWEKEPRRAYQFLIP